MLGRKKKHKRIELERMADKKRQRAPERTAEQIALTRRTFLFKGLAATSFLALTGRLWQLQVIDRAELQELGTSFTERFFPLKAARGLIYDRDRKLLVDNKKSWAVGIVPANLPDDAAEREAIYATLARELKMGDVVTITPKDLPVDGRDDIYQRLAAVLGVPVEPIRETMQTAFTEIAEKLRNTGDPVKVSTEQPPERGAAVRAVERDLLGVKVMNPIQYQVAATYDIYVPQIIKRGIPKEMALGIESNRLYLPGVQIDDQTLSRHYFVGGEEFGHILGYTGPIDSTEYSKAIVRDAQGNPVLDSNGNKKRRYALDDHLGKAGLEAALEELLRGQPGGYVAQLNARGQINGEYTQYRRDPVDGKSVVLTVSVEFQREVAAFVRQGIDRAKTYVEEKNKELKAKGKKEHPLPPGAGAAVVMNPQTGEILAMISLPGYDQRHFAEGISQAQLDQYLEVNVPPEKQLRPLQNRCISANYAAGSTIKPFIAAGALQEGLIKPDTKIRCLGVIQVPYTWDEFKRDPYYCWTRDASHGDLNVLQGIAYSCDVHFYSLGAPKQTDERGNELHFYQPNDPNPTYFAGLGIERMNQYLTMFGFGATCGIELANEVEGLIPGPAWKEATFPGDFWSVGDTINSSIGQGYQLITPLQMCNATAAVANGGTLYRPTLVREVLDSKGNVVKPFTPEVTRKLPINREHLDIVRQGMLMSLTDPKGLVSHTPLGGKPDQFPLPAGIDAGVKTGTAEYGTERDEEGLLLQAHAWTAAFAPFNNPQVCVVAFIEGGSASAAVAAPVASGILNAYFSRYGQQQ